MRVLSVCLMTILIASCAATSDGCAWIEEIVVTTADFPMTRSIKEQIVSHNLAYLENCS